MFPDVRKLGPVCAAESDLVSYQAALPEVEVDEGDDPQALVGLGALLAGPAGDIFASSENNRIHGHINVNVSQYLIQFSRDGWSVYGGVNTVNRRQARPDS